MSRPVLKIMGALLALAGVAILVYALYMYVAQKQLEATLTAQIPGQNTNPHITSTPVVLVPALDNPPPTSLPTMDSTRVSPSVTPFPTHATPVQPDPTSAVNVMRTATAISLIPRTPVPTDEITNILSKPTISPTPTIILAGVAVPTPAEGAPTIDAGAPHANGTPRGTGALATRLEIPKLNLDIPIKTAQYVTFQQNGQLISDWNVPFDAAGHLVTTVQPGEIGNAVLSGHHNLIAPNQFGLGVFAGLWNLSVGDEIRVDTDDGKVQLWRVKETFPIKEGGEPLAVRIQHAQQIMADGAQPVLTLLTCWNGQANPLSGNTYRWVIHAELVNVN